MFSTIQIGPTRYWYNPHQLTEKVEEAFSIEFWQKEERIIGSAQGRGTTWFVQGENGEYALRHYFRGGLLGKIVRDQYIFTGWQQTRAFQELTLLSTLRKHDVNVPEPIAARVTKHGMSYRSDIMIGKISNAQDLVSLLIDKKVISLSTYESIGHQIRKMHEAGVNHTDLNIHNILIDQHDVVWLIDFDKCKQQRGERWKASNIARLQRSFAKEKELHNLSLSQGWFEALMKGYRGQ